MTHNTEQPEFELSDEEAAMVIGAIPLQALPPDTEGEWIIDPHLTCEIIANDTSKPTYLAERIGQTYGDSKEVRAQRAAQIVSDHKAAKSQALLVEALREILTESEFVGEAKAPFTTWIAEKVRAALKAAGVEK